MPLLDPSHPALNPLHRWESFHNRWANAIADALDRTLPSRFFAEVQTHLVAEVEADVAEFEKKPDQPEQQSPNGTAGGVAIETYLAAGRHHGHARILSGRF